MLDHGQPSQQEKRKFSEVDPSEDCSGHLGLKLQKTPSFLNLIASKLSQNTESSMQSNTMEHLDHSDPSLANYTDLKTDLKLKPAHFSISFIKIGFWKKHSQFPGNLVGKFHYNWQKIMWEVVEDGAKNRIVIPWDRICGIRASHPERCKSIIEIELNHQPDFEIEKILEPRKRVKPEPVPDFTQLQASHCRRHWIEVPEEDFNKHYEKILLCCPRLRSISGSSLPASSSLFFQWCPPLTKEFRQPLKKSDSGGSSGTRNLLANSSSSNSVSALKSPTASIASSSLLPGNSAPSTVFSIPSSKGYQFSFNTHPVSNSPYIGNVMDTTAPPPMLVSPSQAHGSMTGITSSSYPLVNSDGMNTTTSISTFVPPFDPHGSTIGITNPSGCPFLVTNSLNSGYPLINSSHIGNAMAPQATMGITGSRDSPFSANFPQTGNVINATTTPPTLDSLYGPFVMGTGVSPPAIGFPISSYSVGISPYTVNATTSLSSLDSSMGVPGLFFPDGTPYASNSLNTATPSNSAWCIASSSTSPSSPVESHIGSNISFANSSSPMPTPVIASATSPPSTMRPVSPLGVAQSSSSVWPSKSLGSVPIGLASYSTPISGHEPFNLNNFEGIDDFESLFWTNPLQDHIEIGGATKEDQTIGGRLKSPSSTSGFAEDIEKFLLDDEFALPEQNGIENNATDSTAQPNEGCESSIPHPSALSDQEFLESWLNFLGSDSPFPTSLDDQPVHDSMGGDWNF